MVKKINIKERFSASLELPKEVLSETPVIKIIGNNEIYIENHKGILEYGTNRIRINTVLGVLVIEGYNFEISEINQEDIKITGFTEAIEFIK
ncbi:sporulation protein YqfC [Fervidicella metallireducens AeB]|uniref:Sporulation protein YqfC n=1 Tax=Fervidicella metallireducens AeB TaxID=1403537 RepID=A0A017RW38_9CLOT|nr:sporulation protein YqfC [Fervidicella metallireducens]EYE88120.1 sporulation protein YqfC [Fervidicella metallireducens AeB]